MADELTAEEKEHLEKFRASKRTPRKVTVRGKGDDGSEYSFELEGEEADRVVGRHSKLWAPDDTGTGGTVDTTGGGKTGGGKYFGQNKS